MMLVSVFTMDVVNAENLSNSLDIYFNDDPNDLCLDDSLTMDNVPVIFVSQFGEKLKILNQWDLANKLDFSFTEDELLNDPIVYLNYSNLNDSNKLNRFKKYLYSNGFSVEEEMFKFDSSLYAKFNDYSIKDLEGLKEPITLQYKLPENMFEETMGIFKIEKESILAIESERIEIDGSRYLEFTQEDLGSFIITPLKSREEEPSPKIDINSSFEDLIITGLKTMEDLNRLGIEFTIDELVAGAELNIFFKRFEIEEDLDEYPHEYKNLEKYIKENNLGEYLLRINIALHKDVYDYSTPITQVNDFIEFTFDIPEELKDMEFELLNFHEGTVLKVVYSIDLEANTITIKSDKFSPFVFVEKKSEDESSGDPSTDNEEETEDNKPSGDDETDSNNSHQPEENESTSEDDTINNSTENNESKPNKETKDNQKESSKEEEIIKTETTVPEQLPKAGAPSIIMIGVPLILIGLIIILIGRNKK